MTKCVRLANGQSRGLPFTVHAHLDIGSSLPFPSVIAFASLKPVSASLRLLDIGYSDVYEAVFTQVPFGFSLIYSKFRVAPAIPYRLFLAA